MAGDRVGTMGDSQPRPGAAKGQDVSSKAAVPVQVSPSEPSVGMW